MLPSLLLLLLLLLLLVIAGAAAAGAGAAVVQPGTNLTTKFHAMSLLHGFRGFQQP
jgi:hypothetical protein